MDQTVAHRLRRTNLIAGCVHLAQGVVILAISNSFALPVQAAYMAGPPGSSEPRQVIQLFELRTAWAVAAFFFLSAIFHLAIAGPWWKGYLANLDRSRNPYRWVEYSLSASIMIVLIAQITGIEDVAALIALFGVNASMIAFGWIQERYERPGGSLTPLWRWHRPVARHWRLLNWTWGPHTRTRLCLRDLRIAVLVLQRVRAQSVAAIPKGRSLGGLPGGGADLSRAEFGGQVVAGVADLRLNTGPLELSAFGGCVSDPLRVG